MPTSPAPHKSLALATADDSTHKGPTRIIQQSREARTVMAQLHGVHAPQVAGLFYPDDPQDLGQMIDELLAGAAKRIPASPTPSPTPKALIVPHAGYIYSGPIAASGYLRLQRTDSSQIRRVVVLGPAHRHGFQGIAACHAAAFETPLGSIPVDPQGMSDALAVPGVKVIDTAYAREHSLEVHLPFLQRILSDFSVVPLIVGMTTPEHVRQVLARLWGGPETLIVISSDLSHFHSAAVAEKLDLETARRIESGRISELKSQQACGFLPIAGLLAEVERQNSRHPEARLGLERLDLRNSSHTSGSTDRVVGYGCWQVRPLAHGDAVLDPGDRPLATPVHSDTANDGAPTVGCNPQSQSAATRPPRSEYTPELRNLLLRTAWMAIRHPLSGLGELTVDPGTAPAALQAVRATFVTLKNKGQLRGCIGTVVAQDPLIVSVAKSAANAAFRDRRFNPVTLAELPELDLSISILSPSRPLTFANEADLIRQLKPHVDGLILRDAGRQSVFLPAVWEQLPAPEEFLQRLKQKAGLPASHWSHTLQIERFTVDTIS